MSDGAMNTLLDFERVLDEADIYAYRNWINGELVQGPDVGRYTCKCTFMWPYKLMPDPRASLRLSTIGCNVKMMKSKIEVPVAVTSYEDFQSGSRYPKMQENQVWFMQIEIPFELMDDIKEGSVDIAEDTIDLSEIEDAYDNDLEQTKSEEDAGADDMMAADDMTPDATADRSISNLMTIITESLNYLDMEGQVFPMFLLMNMPLRWVLIKILLQ